MTEFVRLTKSDGKDVYVNMDLVEYIAPTRGGAALTFIHVSSVGSDILKVQETPEEIVRRAHMAHT